MPNDTAELFQELDDYAELVALMEDRLDLIMEGEEEPDEMEVWW